MKLLQYYYNYWNNNTFFISYKKIKWFDKTVIYLIETKLNGTFHNHEH